MKSLADNSDQESDTESDTDLDSDNPEPVLQIQQPISHLTSPLSSPSFSPLFIVRADLASGRDFHLAAERAELSDFEFYCIFE